MLPLVHWDKDQDLQLAWRTLANIWTDQTIEFIVFSAMVRISKYLLLFKLSQLVCSCLGECAEGSVWESFAFASFYKLDNLCAVIDVNRLGQSDPTQLQHDLETYRKRADAFGYLFERKRCLNYR